MSKPASRVLALLELLQSRGQLDGATLARELQVERRTIRRYVTALGDLGIPVEAERGRFGGYRLQPGYRLPPLMLSDDETLAIGLGLLAVRQLGWAEATPAVASAQAKLERVLPPRLRQRQRAIAERVALDLTRVHVAPHPETLAVLGSAALAQQRVRLAYEDARGEASDRPFDPYGLGFRSGHWYAVGFCGLRQALRSFRLDRVLSATPLPQSFGRPESFDVLGYLSQSLIALPRAHAVSLWVQAPLDALVHQPLAAISSLEARRDGVQLRCQVDDIDWLARSLASLPFDFRVESPPALVEALERVAQALTRRIAHMPRPDLSPGSGPLDTPADRGAGPT